MRVLSFLSFLSFVSAAFAGITSCDGLFEITALSQSPDTSVKAGDNVTLTLKYNAHSEVLGGTAVSSVSINGIPFSPSTEDLCTKVACPISVGDHDGSSWFSFPSGVTSKIVSRVVWKDTQGAQLLCLESTMKAASSYLRGTTSSSEHTHDTSSSSPTSTGSSGSGSDSSSVRYSNTTLALCKRGPYPVTYYNRGLYHTL